MGRYYPDKKETVEERLQISITKLREWGMLNGWSDGTLRWKNRWSESKVGFSISLYGDFPSMHLAYNVTNNSTGVRTEYDYDVPLEQVPCNLGGYRWMFRCPSCLDLVVTLMCSSFSGRYECRECLDLTYESRRTSRRFRPLQRIWNLDEELPKLRESIKRKYYRGKPTRKFRRYLRMAAVANSLEPSLQSFYARL